MSKKPVADAKKIAKPAAEAKSAKPQTRRHLPLLLETSFAIARLASLASGLIVLGVSLQAGATPIVAALRAGLTVLVMGLLLWSANWVLARSALEVVRVQLKEAQQQPAAQSTVELEA
jgi:hypothetical protein